MYLQNLGTVPIKPCTDRGARIRNTVCVTWYLDPGLDQLLHFPFFPHVRPIQSLLPARVFLHTTLEPASYSIPVQVSTYLHLSPDFACLNQQLSTTTKSCDLGVLLLHTHRPTCPGLDLVFFAVWQHLQPATAPSGIETPVFSTPNATRFINNWYCKKEPYMPCHTSNVRLIITADSGSTTTAQPN